MRTKLIILILLFYSVAFPGTKVTIVNSTQEQLRLHVFVNPISTDDLKPIHVLIGLPNDNYPELQLQMLNKQNLNGITDNIEVASVKWIQKQKLRGLNVATLKITPGSDGLDNNQYFQEIIITINLAGQPYANNSKLNDHILSANVINWSIAKNWKKRIAIKRQKVTAEFPTGQLLKFEVENDGMYQINGAELINLIPTVNQHDTRSFSLYTGSNLGRSQSQNPGAPTPDENLIEIAFQYIGSSDGTFSENDNMIFYCKGASGFDLNGINVIFNKNLYFNNNIYWLLIPDDNNLRGKRVTDYHSTDDPTINLDYGIHYQHIETDLVIPFQSG